MSSGGNIKTEADKFNSALHQFVVKNGTLERENKSEVILAALERFTSLPQRPVEALRLEATFQNLCLKSHDLYDRISPAWDEVETIGKRLDAELSEATAEDLGEMADDLTTSPRKKAKQLFLAAISKPLTLSRKSERNRTRRSNDTDAGAAGDVSHESIAANHTEQSSSEDEDDGSDVEEVETVDKSNPVKGMRAKNVTPPSTQPSLDKLRLITVTDIGDLKKYMSRAAQEGDTQMIQHGIDPKYYYEHFLGHVVLSATNASRVIRLVDGYTKVLERIKTGNGIEDGLRRHSDDPKFIKDIMKGVQMVVGDGRTQATDAFLALETKLRAAMNHNKYFGRGPESTNARFAELQKLGKLPSEWGLPLKPGQTYRQKASVILKKHYGIDAKKVYNSLQPVKVLAAFIDATSTGILLFADPVNIVSQFNTHVTRTVDSATAIGARTAELMPELMEFFDFFGNNIVESIWERKELKVVLTTDPAAPWVGDLLTAFDAVDEEEGSREMDKQEIVKDVKESKRYSTRAACTRVEDLDIDGMELDGDDASLA